ncbi:hypothetical protein M0813_23907 [Anaeramoeba flamelloides]|uniref:Homeobox domain-containing protein n=1 Tax=Anaeramoeba flamelloides TaxID=1746091 RepID=A0ABQ8YAI9_9EUKA|nr:hypothetical protein M0813_23907 [Anaeramoeba flamelloides]
MNSQNELLTEPVFKSTINVPCLVEYEKELQVDSLFLNEDTPNTEMYVSPKSNFENDDQVLCSASLDLLSLGYSDTIFRSELFNSNFDSQVRREIENEVIKTETFPEIFPNIDNTENVWSNYNEINGKLSSESLSCYPLYFTMNNSDECVSEKAEEGEKFQSNDSAPKKQQKSKKSITNQKKLCPSSKDKPSGKPSTNKFQEGNSDAIQKIHHLFSMTDKKETISILESLKSNYLNERQSIEKKRKLWVNNYDSLDFKNEFKVNQKNSKRSSDKLKIHQEFDLIHQTLESVMMKSLEQFESDFLHSHQENMGELNKIGDNQTKLQKNIKTKKKKKMKMKKNMKTKKKIKKKKKQNRKRKKEIQLKCLMKKKQRKRKTMTDKYNLGNGKTKLKKRRYLDSKKNSKSKNQKFSSEYQITKKKKKNKTRRNYNSQHKKRDQKNLNRLNKQGGLNNNKNKNKNVQINYNNQIEKNNDQSFNKKQSNLKSQTNENFSEIDWLETTDSDHFLSDEFDLVSDNFSELTPDQFDKKNYPKKKFIKRTRLDPNAKMILNNWITKRISSESGPYATQEEKNKLAEESRITVKQITSYLGNTRNKIKNKVEKGEIEKPIWLY